MNGGAALPPLRYFQHNPEDSPNEGPARRARMQAFVYKSQRRADTYVFLAARDDFALLPEPLRVRLVR